MRIIDKNSEEYLQRLEFYKKMFEKTIGKSHGLSGYDLEYLKDIGRMKTNGINDKDDVAFLQCIEDIGDLGKFVAATTIMHRPRSTSSKEAWDPREEVSAAMLDSMPDYAFYYDEFTTAELGKALRKIYDGSNLVNQIYNSYGLTYSDTGINYGDTIMGIIAIKRIISLHEEFRTMSMTDEEKTKDKAKLARLTEFESLAQVLGWCSRKILHRGAKGFEGLLETPLSEEEKITLSENRGKLFNGGCFIPVDDDYELNKVIAKINSDEPIDEVFKAVRAYYHQNIFMENFIKGTGIKEKEVKIEEYNRTFGVKKGPMDFDEAFPRLAAAKYYFEILQKIAPIRHYVKIHDDSQSVWATIWEKKDYTRKDIDKEINNGLQEAINGPYRNLHQILLHQDCPIKDTVFKAEGHYEHRPTTAIPQEHLDKIAIACSLYTMGNVAVENEGRISNPKGLMSIADDNHKINKSDYRYILRK